MQDDYWLWLAESILHNHYLLFLTSKCGSMLCYLCYNLEGGGLFSVSVVWLPAVHDLVGECTVCLAAFSMSHFAVKSPMFTALKFHIIEQPLYVVHLRSMTVLSGKLGEGDHWYYINRLQELTCKNLVTFWGFSMGLNICHFGTFGTL